MLLSSRRAAYGLGCRIVYTLVPEEDSLQAMREKQALIKAHQINQYTELHMGQEDQATEENFKE